eukprot:1027651-Rhodomonas_salina.1
MDTRVKVEYPDNPESRWTAWALARFGPFSQDRLEDLWKKWMVDEAVGRKRRSDPRTMLLMQAQTLGLDHFKRLDAKLRELHANEVSENTKEIIFCTLEMCTRYFTNPGKHRLPPIPGEGQSDGEGDSDDSEPPEVVDLTDEHNVCDVESREWPLPPVQVKEEGIEKDDSASERESSSLSNQVPKRAFNMLTQNSSSPPAGTSDKEKQRNPLPSSGGRGPEDGFPFSPPQFSSLTKDTVDLQQRSPMGDTHSHHSMLIEDAGAAVAEAAAGAGAAWVDSDVDAKDNNDDDDGWTPLHKAVSNNQVQAAGVLLLAGTDMETENKDGRTPLHVAALSGHVECAIVMLFAGADKESQDWCGHTPLHMAASEGHV